MKRILLKNFTGSVEKLWFDTYRNILVPAQYVAEPLKKIITATANGARQCMWLGGTRSLKTSSMMQLCGWHATGVYPDGTGKNGYKYDGYRFERPISAIFFKNT